MPVTESILTAQFLANNLARASLLEETRRLISEATSDACVVDPGDGVPTLSVRGQLLTGALDEPSIFDLVRNAGSGVSFVVFGLGTGHTARALRGFTDAPLVIYKPDPGIVRAHFESGPCDLNDIPIVCTTHELTQIWPRISHGNQNATLVATPGYSALYVEQAQLLAETLAQLVQRGSINDATHRLRARTWIQDVLANLDVLRESRSFLALAGQYRGVPAFIVGAGPSLGKNGPLLAEAAQKGLVFAVNSSARALASYGVEPQILACMESIDVSHLLRGLPYIDRVVRAISLTAHPQTIRTGRGPLLHVFEGIPQLNGPLSALLGFSGLPVAGSVSTLAFALAQRLGCSPIVLVGQDLAYTDGHAYARGSAYEESRVRLGADGKTLEHDWCETLKSTHNQGAMKMHHREPLREVPAWGGTGTVMSTIGFGAVRAWLESAATVIAKECPEVRLVNATEGGARVAGFEEASLSEVLTDMPQRGLRPTDLEREASGLTVPHSNAQLRDFCAEQADLARTVGRAARRIRRLCGAAKLALEKNDPRRIALHFGKLEVAERELKNAVAAMPFVDAWAHTNIDSAVTTSQKTGHDEHDNATHAIALESSVASVIEDAARELEAELRSRARDFAEPSASSSPRDGNAATFKQPASEQERPRS